MFAIVNEEEIPEYYGKPYVKISKEPFLNENKEIFDFPPQYRKLGEFIISSKLYHIHSAYACLDENHIISSGNTGNRNKNMPDFFHTTHEFIKGKYLYNNCHLIAFQLSGDNSRENRIIGTRYMNEIGMQHFEDEVKVYVKNTGHHVLYRVTPVFNENDQLIKGVQLEAYSLEDEGAGICFNVFIYNVQPGFKIKYENGSSEKVDNWCNKFFTGNTMYSKEENGTQNYILNTHKHKFYNPDCHLIEKINDENKVVFKWPRQFLMDNKCKPCKICKP